MPFNICIETAGSLTISPIIHRRVLSDFYTTTITYSSSAYYFA